MRKYVLTGAPGSGKTAVLRRLEVDGFGVVEEAATDVIALRQAQGVDEPWREDDFVARIVELQCRRMYAVGDGPGVTFLDRSPVCTLALSRWLGVEAPAGLLAAIERMRVEPVVFFVRNLGFVRPTAARRIGFAESLAFERVHEEVYREVGFTIVDVAAGPLDERVDAVRAVVAS
ncbi:AAA family ATPase [Actinoplanes sp. LDG1-06]|uniref:AAA family ATPase n=1 Tax=Paractinoplanes ovalisporus TaxID=2810368 RepID=A0ABS2ALL4_9ACTN|nr:AAA family ATPase [Actinoplanes ovalisporus]MBM2620675.1 AAA family ATPase [Actinoplanes ovalisporus]